MSTFLEEMNKFAQEKVAPFSEQVDKEGRFPKEAFDNIKESGLLTLLISEENGGMGKGIVEHVDACMALGKVCGSTGLIYMMHNVCAQAVELYANDELKKKVLNDLLERKSLLSFAASETKSGTNFSLTFSKSVRNGDEVTINGQKSFVTTAMNADYYFVTTATEVEGENSAWLIPAETDGIEFHMSDWDGFGMRGNASCPMILKDVKINKMYEVGEPKLMPQIVGTSITPIFTVGLAAVYTGILSHILEESIRHVKTRMYPDGNPIASIQAVQDNIAKIYVMEQASINMLYDAANEFTKDPMNGIKKIIAARIYAMDSAMKAAEIGMKLGGGIAYSKRTQMERLLRDAYAGQVMAPSMDGLYSRLGSMLVK